MICPYLVSSPTKSSRRSGERSTESATRNVRAARVPGFIRRRLYASGDVGFRAPKAAGWMNECGAAASAAPGRRLPGLMHDRPPGRSRGGCATTRFCTASQDDAPDHRTTDEAAKMGGPHEKTEC